jgi:hypothetical protein
LVEAGRVDGRSANALYALHVGTEQDAFEADVLVRSLIRFGRVDPADVIVCFADGMDRRMLQTWSDRGCRTVSVRAEAAAPDSGRHSLDAVTAVAGGASGVWLLPLGVAVTAPLPTPLDGAIVLSSKTQIVYLPIRHAADVSDAWSRTGSLRGAIAELGAATRPGSDVDAVTVRCRGRFDAFGLLARNGESARIDALNAFLAEEQSWPYFCAFKRARARATTPHPLPSDDPFVVAASPWLAKVPSNMRLVVHAGTPKTATKALQHALHEGAATLAQRGVWYPTERIDPVQKKHQFLIEQLLAGDGAALSSSFAGLISTAPPGTHTVVISTEGFYNHWWDFPDVTKAMLRHLAAHLNVEFWTVFREPLAFALSQHAQLVRNPREFSPAYGLDADLDAMLDNPWFAQRLDYYGFVCEVEALTGCGGVRLFRYGDTVVERIFRALGAPPPAQEHVNPSLREPGVDIMRIFNRYRLPASLQHRAAALVLELDGLIGNRAEPVRASEAAKARVQQMTARTWAVIEAVFAGAASHA